MAVGQLLVNQVKIRTRQARRSFDGIEDRRDRNCPFVRRGGGRPEFFDRLNAMKIYFRLRRRFQR